MKNCKYYTPHMETIKAYIGCLYELEGCGAGGPLHILVDDNNIEDRDILFCFKYCIEHPKDEGSAIGKLICREYKKLTIQQRRLLSYGYIPCPGCSGYCDSCYIERGDEIDNR